MITTKKSIGYGVKSMGVKAMSYTQVCKQLSGIGGYVAISDKEKVRPLELMWSLGVHVPHNSYRPNDITTAWSERMKKDGKLLIMRSVSYRIVIDGKEYVVYSEKDGEYRAISQSVLVPLVSASDKADKNDVVVNVTNILRGLQQSVFITATMDKIKKSAEKCAALKSGWINMGDKKTEKWVAVGRNSDGTWSKVATAAPKAEKTKATAKGQKKSNTRKAA